jgi:hypothetical protein
LSPSSIPGEPFPFANTSKINIASPEPLGASTPSILHQRPVHILHVSKEFKQASMGGLGQIVNALTRHQVNMLPQLQPKYDQHRFPKYLND